MIVKFNREEYKTARNKWKDYWNWKKNRNKQRAELEEEHGIDTKHASHLVRLLRMGIEALRDGEIIIKRPDADELLAIRNGAWTYDDIIEYAEKMDKLGEEWYTKTSLPRSPDTKKAAEILMEVQKMVWKNKK